MAHLPVLINTHGRNQSNFVCLIELQKLQFAIKNLRGYYLTA